MQTSHFVEVLALFRLIRLFLSTWHVVAPHAAAELRIIRHCA